MLANGMKQLVDFQLPEAEKERDRLKKELGKIIMRSVIMYIK